MPTFATKVNGEFITIIQKRYHGNFEEVEEWILKKGGKIKEIMEFEAYELLKKALEEGNTIEYTHSYYCPVADDFLCITEPILSIRKLNEVFGYYED